MRLAPREPKKDYRPSRRLGVPKSERTTSREDPVSGRLRTEAKARAAHPSSQPPIRKSLWLPPNAPSLTSPASTGPSRNIMPSSSIRPARSWPPSTLSTPPPAGNSGASKPPVMPPWPWRSKESQGTVIDQLLQTPDCTIYPLNPKAAQRYRERKARERHQERSLSPDRSQTL